jgi:hypothetical protein
LSEQSSHFWELESAGIGLPQSRQDGVVFASSGILGRAKGGIGEAKDQTDWRTAFAIPEFRPSGLLG